MKKLKHKLKFSRGTTTLNGDGGELLFGSYNPTLFVPPLQWISITQEDHWNFQMAGVTVPGDSAMTPVYDGAISDTGTSNICIGDPAIFDAIMAVWNKTGAIQVKKF